MKKRLLALTVAMIMAASTLVACGGGEAADPAASTDPAATDDAAATDAPADSAEPAGDAAAADGEFVVYGWNDDIKNILDNVYSEYDPDGYARIRFVNTGGSDTYQEKIDGLLADATNADYPDLMGLEVDYVQKYVNGPDLLSAADLGITDEDMANMYNYNKQLGSDADGNVRAFFWQATPGSFQLRADLAEEYLGSTDPQVLHDTVFCDVDTIVAKAQEVFEASNGQVALFAGNEELLRMFQNSRTIGWYDENDVITIDDQMKTYMETAAEIYPYTFGYGQWATEWTAAMTGDGVESKAAIAYCGCPWFTYWSLAKTMGENEDPSQWVGGTILVEGPYQFFWGGTGLAATVGCSDTELAAKIIKAFTCDTEFMVKINALNSDFVNNTVAVEQIIANGNDVCDMMYGDQAFLGFYLPMADSIDASTITAEDQSINSAFNQQVTALCTGEKDLDTAIADFKAAVATQYTYLTIE